MIRWALFFVGAGICFGWGSAFGAILMAFAVLALPAPKIQKQLPPGDQ